MHDARLDEVYRRAIYRVHAPGGPIDLAVGRRSPALEALLAEHAARRWGFVTAANPRSQALAETENRARTARLAARLAAEGWTVLTGEGLDPAGRWPAEPSFLVLDAGPAELAVLAAELGQAAIVVGEAGDVPRLHWIGGGAA